MLDPNLKVADLSDLTDAFPLDVSETISPFLTKTEPWETSLWRESDLLRYPSVVQNVHGPDPDHRYYLYYAHHDIPSGIGCAVAESITGPYIKIADLAKDRSDSQVLKAQPHGLCPDNQVEIDRAIEQTQENHQALKDYNHLSSPCVLWNPSAECWHLYFHSYRYLWPTGGGHQQTYLATCRDLSTHQWDILENPDGTWKIVLPVTAEKWMNSGSSYHNLCVLPNGRFLATLNGTGGEYMGGTWSQNYHGLGFATSRDGIHWDYFPENPLFESDIRGMTSGMVGYLGDDEYLVVWTEEKKVTYGTTRDFKSLTKDSRGPATWRGALICPWREEDRLYLFAHQSIQIMNLPIG
jgi:hypothetical protein